jgi:hypothetical protein
MLSGTNRAWPFLGSSNNGTSSGTLWTLPNYYTNQGTANGLFCLNCHTVQGSTKNQAHTAWAAGNHKSEPAIYATCTSCHIRVPHGGKVARLMRATGTPAHLPSRYWPSGTGTEVGTQSTFTMSAYKPGTTWNSNIDLTGYTNACSHHSSGTEAW